MTGTVSVGSAAAAAAIRSINVANPAVGTWTLQLVNQDTVPSTIPISASVTGSAFTLSITLGQPTTNGQVQITAAVANSGLPVTRATVTAQLMGTGGASTVVTLPDDGQSGDGLPGDGVYGVLAGPLTPDSYAVVVTATSPQGTRIAVGSLTYAAFQVFLPVAPDAVVASGW